MRGALGGLPDDAPILELPPEDPTLLEALLKLAGVPTLKQQDIPIGWVPPPVMDVARSLIPFVIYEPHKPLARMEMMFQEP